MNIELIKSDINDSLHAAYLIGVVNAGIKVDHNDVGTIVALQELKSMNERKVLSIVEDMHHFCKECECTDEGRL